MPGGVMYWELSNDTADTSSRVNVIYENSRGVTSGEISGTAGRCVGVGSGATTNGTAIQLDGCNCSAAQWWTIDGTGAVGGLGKCLDMPGSSTTNGAQLQLWDCNGTGAQQWPARPDGTLLNPTPTSVWTRPASAPPTAPARRSGTAPAAANQAWALP